MKWMRIVAAVMVTAALAIGAAGCAKKEEKPAQDTGAAAGAGKSLGDAAEKANTK